MEEILIKEKFLEEGKKILGKGVQRNFFTSTL